MSPVSHKWAVIISIVETTAEPETTGLIEKFELYYMSETNNTVRKVV